MGSGLKNKQTNKQTKTTLRVGIWVWGEEGEEGRACCFENPKKRGPQTGRQVVQLHRGVKRITPAAVAFQLQPGFGENHFPDYAPP